MTTLAPAFVFWAAFLATISPRFWSDLLRSASVVLVGLVMASLWRELVRAPMFAFDQHVAFATGTALAIVGLIAKSQPVPSFLCASFVLWGALEVLALLYLGHPASPREYAEQKIVAYWVLLGGVWAVVVFIRSSWRATKLSQTTRPVTTRRTKPGSVRQAREERL